LICATGFVSITRLGTNDPRCSQIVKYSGIVYLTGQVGTKEALANSDITQQTLQTLAKIDALLSEAGTSKSQLIEARIWLRDISKDYSGMNAVWNAWVSPDNKPARVCTEARLAHPDMLVEIQVTAAEGRIGGRSRL
jgi:enamine deaminase RidA (YjgF/YER057c/UK114 family)